MIPVWGGGCSASIVYRNICDEYGLVRMGDRVVENDQAKTEWWNKQAEEYSRSDRHSSISKKEHEKVKKYQVLR